ncbi:hypothetical protein [Candidatus Pantoea persica]|uniref:hypothetical protein n=1 Tax=Candidatus Pantoea persica TaxID=2518128 RepID=UPI00215D8331|nr:hypothetical protein [Candidatus Pantoea persica]MBA2815900.1 hypothetical protein [Candidatus Pantoea persica]
MMSRFNPLAVVALVALSGCAKKQASQDDAGFTAGSAQVSVSHVRTHADDGSSVFVTVDGKDAGQLNGGQSKDLFLTPGKHKIGGYVATLFGLGRVTINPVEVTTAKGEVKHVAYEVKKDKPTFTEWTPPAEQG